MALRRWVVAVGLGAIGLALVLLLFESAPRRSGSDLTPNGAFVAGLGSGQRSCQGSELVPADTSALQMTIGTFGRPGPPLSVAVYAPDGTQIASGGVPGGWHQGVVRIPVSHVGTAVADARICIRDDAPAANRLVIALAGDMPDPGFTMEVAGRIVGGHLRYDFLRPGSESWWQLLPTIVYRSTLAKAGLVRHWAWLGAVLLMLAAVALAARTVLREEPGAAEDAG